VTCVVRLGRQIMRHVQAVTTEHWLGPRRITPSSSEHSYAHVLMIRLFSHGRTQRDCCAYQKSFFEGTAKVTQSFPVLDLHNNRHRLIDELQICLQHR
jgi:hypothetical protein